MNITLYNNLGERNVIQKTLANADTITGTLKESTSIKNPIITIEYPPTIAGYNYCYIEDFARYYFISDIKSLRNNLWSLSLRVDVLMSFANDILNTPAIIDHTSETETTNYMNSPIWGSLVKDKTDIINFSSGLTESGGYVLITAGG